MLGKSTLHNFVIYMFACFPLYTSPINLHLICDTLHTPFLHYSIVRFLSTGLALGVPGETEEVTFPLNSKQVPFSTRGVRTL